jgi:hypothetical protein
MQLGCTENLPAKSNVQILASYRRGNAGKVIFVEHPYMTSVPFIVLSLFVPLIAHLPYQVPNAM